MSDQMGRCDGCGTLVPLEELSLTTFPEKEGFACEGCKRDTAVALHAPLTQRA